MKLLKENDTETEAEANFGMNDNEDSVDPNEHIKLIKAISKLDKTQHIQKPSRDGYSSVKSEFHVSNSFQTRKNAVEVSDIINILEKKSEYAPVTKKIKTTQTINKTLEKPIEKYEAEKLNRATGFEEVSKSLGKWDAVVSRNRTIEHQKFPLNNDKVGQLKSKDLLSKFSLISDLEKELNEIDATHNEEVEESVFPMTMNELIEHRQEVARLRAKQSYKEAKARRQKKIKSKKFHRILRKEKIKNQLNEFQQLQKTDPEEALRRLEQLEKTRAQERVSLRHKSTGQWAKNKLVRAKYDKETRQQLAEQLAISKELTQKQVVDESESEEEKEEDHGNEQDSSNPWLPKTQPSEDIIDFVSGYKKYWEERNKIPADAAEENDIKVDQSNHLTAEQPPHSQNVPAVVPTRKKRNRASVTRATSQWAVEDLTKPVRPTKLREAETETKSLDEIFEETEWKLETNLKRKLDQLKSSGETTSVRRQRNAKKEKKDNSKHLDFKSTKLRPEIDAELDETALGATTHRNDDFVINTDVSVSHTSTDKSNAVVSNKIDPNKFVSIKPKHLASSLPDMECDGDLMDDDERRLMIAEAFEDDDIVADFQQDKENEKNKDKPKVEDLELPGWGSWVGKNMRNPKRRRRMIFNLPDVVPRKDDKKDNVIINENKSAKLRAHQVSELPFPFTSVAEYEASIRAPIGNTFIPETAHKKLVKPAVIVKRGVVIDPMDESQLIQKKRMAIKDDDPTLKPLFKIK